MIPEIPRGDTRVDRIRVYVQSSNFELQNLLQIILLVSESEASKW